MVTYPVVLLTAACFGIIMVLHLRPQPDWSWILFQIGLGLEGLAWMLWNVQMLSGKTADGSLLNELFSVASIIIGASAMRWRMVLSDSVRYERWCEGILRMLPLGSVVIAAMASMWAMSRYDFPELQHAVLYSALAVIACASLRQSLILKEREQLLQAEKAVDESHSLLLAIIDTAPIRVFWKDRDLRYLGCNTAFARDAGLATAEGILGKDDYQMAWRDQAELYRSDDFPLL